MKISPTLIFNECGRIVFTCEVCGKKNYGNFISLTHHDSKGMFLYTKKVCSISCYNIYRVPGYPTATKVIINNFHDLNYFNEINPAIRVITRNEKKTFKEKD